MQNNIQDNVIACFREKGYERNQYISQATVRQVFDERAQAILNVPFKTELMDDILDRCKNEKLQISPRSIGESLSQAYLILKERLSVLGGQNGLIHDRQMAIYAMKQKLQNSNSTNNNNQSQNNELMQQIDKMQRQLAQFENNQGLFVEEIQLIENLFKNYVGNIKKRKGYKDQEINPIQVNPRKLTFIFYLALVGLLIQFIAVQLRPGWIAIVIYLQALYLLFIGYYNKNAVKYLIFTAGLTILADSVALILLQFLKMLGTSNKELNKMSSIQLMVLKIFLFASILARIGVIFTSCQYIEPPIVKTSYEICGKSFPLNTRLQLPNRASTANNFYS